MTSKLNVAAATTITPSVSGQTVDFGAIANLSPTDTAVIAYTARPSASYAWTTSNTGAAYAHVNSATVTATDTSGASGNDDGDYEDLTPPR